MRGGASGARRVDGTGGEERNYMPLYGMKTPRATFVAVARKMSWRWALHVVATNGV